MHPAQRVRVVRVIRRPRVPRPDLLRDRPVDPRMDRMNAPRRGQRVVELNRFAALFGIPRDRLPTSWLAHEAYMHRMLGSDLLAVAPCAREMAMFLIGRAGSHAQPPLGRLAEAVTATMLPEHLARDFGLAHTKLSAAGVRLGLAAFAPIYRRLPQRMVAIPARAMASRRIKGQPPSRLASWTERQLFGLSRQVTGV